MFKSKKKPSNFYLRWQESQKADRQAKNRSSHRMILLSIAILGLCVGLLAGIRVYTALCQAQTQQNLDWCNEPQNQADYTSSIEKQTQSFTYKQQKLGVAASDALIKTYPSVTSSVMRGIEAAGSAGISVNFTSYDSTTGVLSFDAQSDDVIDIPSYVRALEATNLFDSVTYTGYGFNNANKYTINLCCVLAAPELPESEVQP